MRHLAAILAFTLAPLALAQPARLDGGGSSFVNPLMVKWTTEYATQTGVEINYQAIGSGAGVQKVARHEFDFGCTDSPLNRMQAAEAYQAGGAFLHVPLVMGAVVPVYNLPGLDGQQLRLDGPTLADIFQCKLTRWNDPRIATLNPGLKLPDLGIVVVRRADGSGSTFILANYFCKVSPEWRDQYGAANTLDWPKTTLGEKGTSGVTKRVKDSPGAIGYVELLYATKSKLPHAALKNRAGEFVIGSHEGVQRAAVATLRDRVPPSFCFSMTDAPGAGSYPLAGTTWAVLYTKPTARQREVVKFLQWATGERGQQLAEAMECAPLPAELRTPLAKRLAELLESR